MPPKAAKNWGIGPHNVTEPVGNTWCDLWDIEHLRNVKGPAPGSPLIISDERGKKLTRKKAKISSANAENAVFFRVP